MSLYFGEQLLACPVERSYGKLVLTPFEPSSLSEKALPNKELSLKHQINLPPFLFSWLILLLPVEFCLAITFFNWVLRKKGSKTKKRTKEGEGQKGDYRSPIRKVWDFVELELHNPFSYINLFLFQPRQCGKFGEAGRLVHAERRIGPGRDLVTKICRAWRLVLTRFISTHAGKQTVSQTANLRNDDVRPSIAPFSNRPGYWSNILANIEVYRSGGMLNMLWSGIRKSTPFPSCVVNWLRSS